MSNNQSHNSIGEQIKGALSEALQSGDFSNLNELVSQSVTSTLSEVGKHISFIDNSGQEPTADHSAGFEKTEKTNEQTDIPLWQQQARERNAKQQQNWQEHLKRGQEKLRWQTQQMQNRRGQTAYREPDSPAGGQPSARSGSSQNRSGIQPRSAAPPAKINKVGNVSGILYQVFGGIGLGVTVFMTFLHLTLLLSNITTGLWGWCVNIAFLALFSGMIRHGISQKNRLKRAERYVRLCEGRLYGEIDHLAKSTGQKAKKVVKDLQKMLKAGMFPEGHLDEKKTCLMLSDGIYRQYLETENNRRLREEEDQKSPRAPVPDQREHSESESSPDISTEQEAELNVMVAEGMECIEKLRHFNDNIPGEVISAKLFRLENLLKNIFDSVREHPEQMHRMHRLMDYYLPTTLKLVEAYEGFDRVSSPGEDILAAKAEIENTLDTINQAFTELLNNLFQDAVLDATTDAQVLKTMLAREGLTREMNFSGREAKEDSST